MYSTDAELSSSLINQVFQDSRGSIWILTQDGVNCYDGAKFRKFEHSENNASSLLHNYARVVFEDSSGRLLFGFFDGLQIYDYDTQSFRQIPLYTWDKVELQPHVTSITERKNGDILIGTSGFGIFVLSEERGLLSAIQKPQLSNSGFIHKLFEDDMQNLWILSQDQGLFKVSPSREIHQFFDTRPGEGGISDICQHRNGNIYASNLHDGLFEYDKGTNSFSPVTKRLPVKTLYVNRENDILIGTDGEGIRLFDPETGQINDLNPGINRFDFSKTKIHSITEDQAGNLWVGIYQKGVMLIPYASKNFRYIGYQSAKNNTIGSNCVMSVFKDHKGVVWVGTDGDGLYGVTPDGRQLAHFAPPGAPASIMTIYEDSENRLWVGSYLEGLARVDRKTGIFHYGANSTELPGNVYAITEDQDKNLWIGSMGGGLFLRDPITGRFTNYCNSPNGKTGDHLNNKWINCLLHTGDNRLYIGTYDGLSCLDLETKSFLTTYGTNHILGQTIIYALYEDNKKNLWIGTSEGLYCKPEGRDDLKKYTVANGLPSNFICAIKGDRENKLWISTHHGISKFDPKKQQFFNYYLQDGLQGNEFSKGAAHSGHSGHLIFGGTNGITLFSPELITDEEKTPRVKITACYVENREVRKGIKSGAYDIISQNIMESDTINLSHRDNTFSLELATTNFIAPEKIVYHYSLNQNEWVSLRRGVNTITFNDLLPGNYTFRVRAEENKLFSPPREITVVIHPPWYATAGAKTGYAVFIVLMGLLIYKQIRQRYKTREKIRKQQYENQVNEAKLQFFVNISHEIKTPISLIINPVNKLIRQDSSKERQKTYKTIQRNSERILRLTNQLIDVRKMDKGQISLNFQKTEIIGFIQKVCTLFKDQVRSKNILFEFKHDMDLLYMYIDPGYFDKVIQNVLSNAFKFTPHHGSICIKLEKRSDKGEDRVRITVSDSGTGIKPGETERIFNRFYQDPDNTTVEGTGIGLHFTRSIVSLHHGRIWAENNSTPGEKGAVFIMEIPLEAHYFKLPSSPAREVSLCDYQPKREPYITHFSRETDENDVARSKTRYSILIVDDDKDIRNYLRKELASLYHVAECSNGKEALARILQKNPDLVISDIKMPETDGITLCKKIKQNVNINHIPVILLTARTTVNDNIKGLSMGADVYLSKPFNIEILKKTVHNLIKNRELLKNIFSGNQIKESHLYKINIKSADEKLLQKATQFINDNIDNPELNVEMMAAEIGISRVHLFRKLKELTNQSPRDFIKNIRLKQAGELLTSKKLSITEVAYATGFSNVSKFSSGFKEFYGMPPSAYKGRTETVKNV
ncbi:response regulator [Sinomicrobium kalidii]|uniref:hybrid sensor histidine kinase/response regulator transcription factor n=1 Tax=Sinomicrobium kalidii TaxID=2900738 RepID=UPI001E33C8DF|nr:hybrid sensor histidine kinase/response regulator transcription factor [Sinomicrobium kalidii]UGU17701.1 response regulator [Sinomicrobium kalidii]